LSGIFAGTVERGRVAASVRRGSRPQPSGTPFGEAGASKPAPLTQPTTLNLGLRLTRAMKVSKAALRWRMRRVN
jgi:hypothetical protein